MDHPARRSPRIVFALGAILAIAGCGAPDDRPHAPAQRTGPFDREVITAEMESQFAHAVSDRRDVSLAAGSTAPELDVASSKRTTVIVFFRGAW